MNLMIYVWLVLVVDSYRYIFINQTYIGLGPLARYNITIFYSSILSCHFIKSKYSLVNFICLYKTKPNIDQISIHSYIQLKISSFL